MSSSQSRGKSNSKSEDAGASGRHMTTDHEEIRQWAKERNAKPSCVKGTGGAKDVGLLRFDLPGYSGAETLQEISWDEFFNKFDNEDLVFLYQERTAHGERSNFNKLISAETAAS